ncbi:MAG: hypothetical protein ACI8W3_000750 [Myxococcota bacterium]|jgi:hypothetical protein
MRISVKRHRVALGLFGFVHLVVAFAPMMSMAEPQSEPSAPNVPAARAESDELIAEATDEIERWIPSLSIAMGLLLQETEGGFATGVIKNTDWVQYAPAVARIRPSASGSNLNITPIATIGLEGMTPGLRTLPGFPDIKIPGRPRFFVHGDIVPSFGPTYRTAKRGDPGKLTLGLPPTANINREEVMGGQGGLMKSRIKQWIYGGGAGIALTADFWGRRLRVKPSFEYMTEVVEVKAVIKRALAVVVDPRELNEFTFLVLNASESKRFHGLGAGIEFELDGKRAGPIMLSVFASARGYRFMGDMVMTATGRNENDESFTMRFKKDRYAYRSSVGVRIRFAPN